MELSGNQFSSRSRIKHIGTNPYCTWSDARRINSNQPSQQSVDNRRRSKTSAGSLKLTVQLLPDRLSVKLERIAVLLFVCYQSWTLCIERIHQNHSVRPIGQIPAGNQAAPLFVEVETPLFVEIETLRFQDDRYPCWPASSAFWTEFTKSFRPNGLMSRATG